MPLSTVSNLNLYRQNPFRITGLPVDASVKEIARLTEKLKILADLGEASHQQFAFALDPAPTVDQIREASQCMKEPEQRLAYGFFWFWPANGLHASGDPAMLALERGEQNKAYEIWLDREGDPAEGFIAKHNLAVMFQLIAQDWTHYQLNAEVDAERETKIRNYWRESLSRWTDLTSEDRIWDVVRDRIRAFDDPRITTGMARRLPASLKQAVVRINAEAALKFGELDRFGPARMHLGLISEIEPNSEEVVKVLDSVLAPKREAIRLHLKNTENLSDTGAMLAAVRRLIQEANLHLPLFKLFYPKDAHQRTELFDDVAAACSRCGHAHRKATEDDAAFVEILNEALFFATSVELRERLTDSVKFGLSNLAVKKHQAFFDGLKAIEESKMVPRASFDLIQNQIIPKLRHIVARDADAADAVSDRVAIALRRIGLNACNNYDDVSTAQLACELALELCKDREIRKMLLEDRQQLAKLATQEDANNLLLEIRGDAIEVNRNFIRCNGTRIAANEVSAVKYGVFKQYTNGTQTSCSYLICVRSDSGNEIKLECKRFFRSEDQAIKDYTDILKSMHFHIIPKLALKIAHKIERGSYTIGACTLNKAGIRLATGMWLCKKEHIIPWDRVAYYLYGGSLHLSDKSENTVSQSYELRNIWNAVIFEQIAKALLKLNV